MLSRPSRESVAVQDFEKIPAGGYQVGILGAEIKNFDWGKKLIIKFDVCEGEFKNHYTNQFKNCTFDNAKFKGTLWLTIPDENSEYFENQQKTFWRNIYAIEDSNTGYEFDLDFFEKLKGKKAGIILGDKEWEFGGKSGISAQPSYFIDIKKVKSGDFKLPKVKLLPNHSTPAIANTQDFETFEEDDDDLPF